MEDKKYYIELTCKDANHSNLMLKYVKLIKDSTGMGLKEAKDAYDAVRAGQKIKLWFKTKGEARRAVPALTDIGFGVSYAGGLRVMKKLEYLRDMIEEYEECYRGPVKDRKPMRSLGDLGYIDKIIYNQEKYGERKLSPKDVSNLNKMYHYYRKNMLSW